jgi:hypothetical protein
LRNYWAACGIHAADGCGQMRYACGSWQRRAARVSARQSRTHRLKYLLVTRESHPTFSGHELLVNPHGEFAAVSTDGVNVQREFFLQQGRHTGGARRI